jgi:hypothetical protein
MPQSNCKNPKGFPCFLLVTSNEIVEDIGEFIFNDGDLWVVLNIEELKHSGLCPLVGIDEGEQFLGNLVESEVFEERFGGREDAGVNKNNHKGLVVIEFGNEVIQTFNKLHLVVHA